MNITAEKFKIAFREEDIEGLIGNGAPNDEYASEAEQTLAVVRRLSEHERTKANIVSIIALIWAKSFNREPEEIAERMPAFENVALKLLQP
ncbi:MAG: hypothetical protein ACOYJ2_01440 [Rickettsiales bacterium]